MKTTLKNIVLLVERMNEAMTQHRQMKPAEEWYMYAKKNMQIYAARMIMVDM